MRQLELTGREVQVWTIRLEATEQNFARVSAWLSSDEIERAARFRFEKHRRAFVLGRAALRGLLASYSGMSPQDAAFTYGPKGKPALRDAAGLSFNVSNSGDLAAYAFTRDIEIGVDIEYRRRVVDVEAIAERFFAPEEVAELMRLEEGDRMTGFFNCWTRKEAYIKAVGVGLSVPLHSFQVTLGASPRMVSLNGSAPAAQSWTMHAFSPAPDYTGAIAYLDQERSVATHRLVGIDELLSMLPACS
jgi:4'-phosphopantetheinyl transferase